MIFGVLPGFGSNDDNRWKPMYVCMYVYIYRLFEVVRTDRYYSAQAQASPSALGAQASGVDPLLPLTTHYTLSSTIFIYSFYFRH